MHIFVGLHILSDEDLCVNKEHNRDIPISLDLLMQSHALEKYV